MHYQCGFGDIRVLPPRPYGIGDGGLKQCTECQLWTSSTVCVNCHTRTVHPATHFAAMRQAQLVSCKQIGCRNGVFPSKDELCSDCLISEGLRQQNARKTSANLKYSYY